MVPTVKVLSRDGAGLRPWMPHQGPRAPLPLRSPALCSHAIAVLRLLKRPTTSNRPGLVKPRNYQAASLNATLLCWMQVKAQSVCSSAALAGAVPANSPHAQHVLSNQEVTKGLPLQCCPAVSNANRMMFLQSLGLENQEMMMGLRPQEANGGRAHHSFTVLLHAASPIGLGLFKSHSRDGAAPPNAPRFTRCKAHAVVCRFGC